MCVHILSIVVKSSCINQQFKSNENKREIINTTDKVITSDMYMYISNTIHNMCVLSIVCP